MLDLLQRIFGRDDRAAGYAAAVVAVADAEGAGGRVEDELFAFAKALEQHPELREALTDRALPVDNRVAVIREVIGDRAHPVTVNVISFIVESGRARELGKIAEDAVAIAAERREHAVAEVRSAVPLTEHQRERLERALSRATGRTGVAKVVVDPSVVGGVVARVGDLVFDGSVSSRLEDAKHALGS